MSDKSSVSYELVQPVNPKVWVIKYCDVCERDDRYQPFTGRFHLRLGKRCSGQPRKLLVAEVESV